MWRSGAAGLREMSEEPLIRDALARDVERVVEIWIGFLDFHARLDPRFARKAGSEREFAQHLERRLAEEDCLLLVAEVEEGVVGYLNGELGSYPPCFAQTAHGVIQDLAVDPPWQRRGLGTALLQAAMVWFQQKGVSAVETGVLAKNPLATGFWKRAGFEPYMQTFRGFTGLRE